jgi:predicted RNA methylase
MRKKANLLKSSRGPHSTSLNDLVTQSEHTMSSQASVYTNTSKNSRRDNSQKAQSSAQSQDFDDYEDIIAEDIDTLFITPEEERKIQGILEFARKGVALI